MKVVVLIIFVIEFSFCLSSCNSYQRKVRNIVKEWSGKEIVFPSLDAKIMGRDTIISCISDYKYKILKKYVALPAELTTQCAVLDSNQ